MRSSISSVKIHPVFNQAFVTLEHPEGELDYLGDALGRDFMAIKFVNGFSRLYANEGRHNEDWYSYQLDVLAPCDAIVEKVHEVPEENQPGAHINQPAGSVIFRCEDNTRICYAHLTKIQVTPGERVITGQVFAKCGNNGTSWNPHVHVGAWKDDQPLQIRVDLSALGKIQKQQGRAFYFLSEDKVTQQDFTESFKK